MNTNPNFDSLSLLFMGPPYSGKKTMMAKLYNLMALAGEAGSTHVLNAGAELKKIASVNSSWGKTVKTALDKKMPVQDVIMGHVFSDFMKNVKSGDTLLLNGFPRNEAQASWFDEEFATKNLAKPIIIVHIVISAECSFNRMYNSPAEIEKEELIRQFGLYDENILPVLNWFKDDDGYLVIEVDGERPEEVVFEEIFQKIRPVLIR